MGKTGFVQKLLGTVRSGREVWSDLSLETFFFQFLFIYLAAGLSCSTPGLRSLQPAGSLVTG